MKKVEITEKATYTCDTCKMTATNPEGRYSFEELEVDGLRHIEKINKNYFETKHITKRKEVNFCSQECARVHLSESINSFLMELAPKEDRTREEFTLE